MIISRAEHLLKTLDRRDALRVDVRRLEAFQTRAVQIATAVERITPLAAACRLLRERGAPVPREGALMAEAVEQLEVLRKEYRKDRSGFIDTRKVDFRRFSKVFENSCANVESEIRSTWKAYVEQRKPPTSNEILSVLVRVPAYASQVAEIREGAARLAALLEQIPTKEADFSEVEGIITRIRKAWEDLDTSALSESVLAFLRACDSPYGAPLTLLAEDVRQWIEEHGLANSFRVHAGGDS